MERSKAAQVEKELDETSSIEPEKPISEYPYNEQEVLKDYTECSDKKFEGYVESVLYGDEIVDEEFYFNEPTERAQSIIKELAGTDVSEFKTSIEPRIVEHIEIRHGKNGVADHSMEKYVLDNFDEIKLVGRSSAYTTVKPNGKTALAPTIEYSKKINGTYYVIQAVPNTNQNHRLSRWF